MFSGTPTLLVKRGGRANCPVAAPGPLLSLLLVGLLFSGLAAAPKEESSVPVEYQLKAALLYQFTKYVEWPANRFSNPGRPIIIGIMGHNPFGDELDRVLKGRSANGHGFVVKQIYSLNDIPSVDLLFVAAGQEARAVGNTMDLIQAPGVLTVGETGQFTALGGVITFVEVDETIRFEINLEAAKRAGLTFSPQLLKLSSHGKKKL